MSNRTVCTVVYSLLFCNFASSQSPNLPPTNAGGNLPSVHLRAAPQIRFPGGHNPNRNRDFLADCNSPAHWSGDTLYVFNSWERPWRSRGRDLFHLGPASPVEYTNSELYKLWLWLESTHRDDNGTLYGWVHNELPNQCPNRGEFIPGYPVVARIGALRSRDDGAHWDDLGFVLESPPDSIRCDTESSWYATGVGDFYVISDLNKQYIYFFFTNLRPELPEQGLCIARMRYADRDNPRGNVWIWHQGKWKEPGIGGHATPIFPAAVDLTKKDGQTFWGPVIHWNTHLNRYVMVVNRIKDTRWTTEGLYVSFNQDLSNPKGWSPPQRFMVADEATSPGPWPKDSGGYSGWYVEVMGTGKGETDKQAGRVARLFVQGRSRWEIIFLKPGEKTP